MAVNTVLSLGQNPDLDDKIKLDHGLMKFDVSTEEEDLVSLFRIYDVIVFSSKFFESCSELWFGKASFFISNKSHFDS